MGVHPQKVCLSRGLRENEVYGSQERSKQRGIRLLTTTPSAGGHGVAYALTHRPQGFGSRERSKQRAIQEGSKEEGERDMGSVMTDLRMPS
jgi:hypothetical protein